MIRSSAVQEFPRFHNLIRIRLGLNVYMADAVSNEALAENTRGRGLKKLATYLRSILKFFLITESLLRILSS
jgi:hypothetical protein